MQIRSLYTFLSIFFLGGTLFCQNSNEKKDTIRNQISTIGNIDTVRIKVLTPREQLDANIVSMDTDPVLKTAHWGFVLFDPKTKKVLAGKNENSAFVPASTTKLLTTETAVSYLGEKYRWNTQLEFSGSIDKDSILQGNLYLLGSGDPSLGTRKAGSSSYAEIVATFIDKIKDLGIKKINGDIIVQSVLLKQNITKLPENIVWADINNYYLPVGSTKNSSPNNERLIVKKTPEANGQRYFYVSPYTNQMVYADQYEGDGTLSAKLPPPPTFLANALRANLLKNKISIAGKVISKPSEIAPESRKKIATYSSPTLEEIMYYTNQRSDNALAESFLKFLGFWKLADYTKESGAEVVKNHLKNSGFDMDGFVYVDGSGLSRENKVSPISQVKFLTALMSKKYFKSYFDSLPIGGQTGTLKKMFGIEGNGQVFAKTGTLNGVKTLAGFLKTNSGKTYVFSILINGYRGGVEQVKRKIEKILQPCFNF